jgi:hypothetical protein
VCALCGYYYSTENSTKYFLNLLKKWEDKKAHNNMVTKEPLGNKMKDEEADVWVVI